MSKESYTVRQIKKLYDIKTDYQYVKTGDRILIRTFIIFKPKEITVMTPFTCISDGKFYYYFKENRLSFEYFEYIRNDCMPILSYTQQEYFLDNFCEMLSYNELNRVLKSKGYNVSFSPPNTEI